MEKHKKILIWLAVGLVVTAGVVVLELPRGRGVVHLLCDGFLMAAVALLALGSLKFVRNQGLFDLFGYAFSNVFRRRDQDEMGVPLTGKKETFAEYEARKKATRKSAGDLLWAGAVYLALSGVMTVLYLAIG